MDLLADPVLHTIVETATTPSPLQHLAENNKPSLLPFNLLLPWKKKRNYQKNLFFLFEKTSGLLLEKSEHSSREPQCSSHFRLCDPGGPAAGLLPPSGSSSSSDWAARRQEGRVPVACRPSGGKPNQNHHNCLQWAPAPPPVFEHSRHVSI